MNYNYTGIVLLLLLLSGYTLSNTCPTNKNVNVIRNKANVNYRLPNDTVPLHYDLTLETDLDNFNGSVKITIFAKENTNTVTLHAQNLEVIDLIVTNSNDEEITIKEIEIQEDVNFFVIHLVKNLIQDEIYYLNFRQFRGKLATDNDGFYLALYEENGIEKRMATTQFESTAARKAYPCYDEPGIKATFTVSLIHPDDYTSISNEVLESSEKIAPGKIRDNYRKSVKMSAYLTAFVVSQFSYIQTERHRVFARPEYIHDGLLDYALNTGYEVLRAFELYLGVNYTLEKMDQIGIPDKYYAPGAMENWGLVTFRESYLLINNETNFEELESTTTVIAHEFGHQWFGNLVTLKWWRYLWLNEGFANFMQYLGTDKLKPSWKILDKMVVENLQYVLGLDSRANTQPLNYESSTGSGPTTYISYQKGGSVLRMIQHLLTPDIFRRGLNIYLTKFQFQAVEPDNLFSSWQEAITTNYLPEGDTVNSILTPWVTLPGYPVLNVDRYDGGIQLSQKRFVESSIKTREENLWPIPINIASRGDNFSDTTPTVWLKTQKETIPDQYDSNDWIIVNKQQTGYYRVNYDETNWNKLIKFLLNENINEIHLLNRAQLIDDSFKLAKLGYINYDIPLNLSKYINKETEYVPLLAYQKNVKNLRNLLKDTKEQDLLKIFIWEQFKQIINKLGYEENVNDNDIDKIIRSDIIKLLCSLNINECVKNANISYKKWIDNGKQMSPNLQESYFCAVLKSNKNEFDYLFNYMIKTKQSNLRKRLIKSLICVEDEYKLNRLFNKVLRDKSLSENDKIEFIMNAVYENDNQNFVINYLEKNFDDFKDNLNLERILMDVSRTFVKKSQITKLKTIITKHFGTRSSVNVLVEEAEENVSFNERSLPLIKRWFIENVKY